MARHDGRRACRNDRNLIARYLATCWQAKHKRIAAHCAAALLLLILGHDCFPAKWTASIT
jgi:hypothetical protein